MSKRELKMSNSHVTMVLHQIVKLFCNVLRIMVGGVLTDGQMNKRSFKTTFIYAP